MKKLITILLLCLTSSVAVSSVNDDLAEITLVLQKYLDGTSQGKPELVQEAFLPSLEIQWLDDKGDFRRRKADSYINNIKVGESVPRFGKIVGIDVTGHIAQAKVEIRWNNRYYTDYMLLMRVNKKWRISNKIAYWFNRQ